MTMGTDEHMTHLKTRFFILIDFTIHIVHMYALIFPKVKLVLIFGTSVDHRTSKIRNIKVRHLGCSVHCGSQYS